MVTMPVPACPCRHLIDTLTYKVTPNVYCLGRGCTEDVQGTCLTTETFDGPRGKRMLVTSMSLAQVRQRFQSFSIWGFPGFWQGVFRRPDIRHNRTALAPGLAE